MNIICPRACELFLILFLGWVRKECICQIRRSTLCAWDVLLCSGKDATFDIAAGAGTPTWLSLWESIVTLQGPASFHWSQTREFNRDIKGTSTPTSFKDSIKSLPSLQDDIFFFFFYLLCWLKRGRSETSTGLSMLALCPTGQGPLWSLF